MDAAYQLDAALAPVEEELEIPGHLAQIIAQRRRLWVKRSEIQSHVMIDLRDRAEAPALALQFAVIGFLEVRDPYEPPVIAVGPTVIRASEGRGIAATGATQPVAAMATNIEERAHLAARIAHHENRVLAHVSREEVAGLRDLTLVTQEEPTAGEDPLQFLLVDLRLDKDAAADETLIVIDHPAHFCGHSDCLL